MNSEIQTRIVIGGPARCGKTSLSARIAAADNTCFVLGVDALFRAILRKGIVNRVQPTAETVRHFLSRRRFQDAARETAESPLDYTPLDLDTLMAQSGGSRREHPVRVYGRTIDAMASAAGNAAWVAFDLHPEFAYRRLRRLVPGLKLAIMFRDPREAIAAALYWRRPDGAPKHTRREFRRALLLWGMAAKAARAHRARWPDDIRIVTLPELFDGSAHFSIFGISARTGPDPDLSPETLHFRLTDTGFALPDGREAPLLSRKEIGEIMSLLGPLAEPVGLVLAPGPAPTRTGFGLHLYFHSLMTLASWSPQNAAALLDIVEAPFGALRRRLALLREAATALIRRRTMTDQAT